MPSRRIAVAGLILLCAGFLTSAFIGSQINIVEVSYGLLIVIYLSLLGYHWIYSPSAAESTLLLLLAVVVGKLAVLDPVEPGLYGVDSYMALDDQIHYFDAPLSESIVELQAWPLFYAFVESVYNVVGVPLPTVAKYIPLITIIVPVFAYLTARRLMSDPYGAFVVGFAAATTKTMLLFETKFVDETIALVLFFAALVVISTSNTWTTPRRILLLPLFVGVVLSHPIAAFFIALFGMLFEVVGVAASYTPKSLDQLVPKITTGIHVPANLLIIHMTIFISLYLTIGARYTVASVLFSEPGSFGSGQTRVGLSVLIADYLFFAVLLSFVVILLVAFFSSFEMEFWVLVVAVMCGLLTGYFALTIALGKPIGLDQSRVLVFLLPLLFLSGGAVLLQTNQLSGVQSQQVLTVLITIFVISQVAAVPVHVLVSDPTNTVPNTDRSQTVSERSAIIWGSKFTYAHLSDTEGIYRSQGLIETLGRVPQYCSGTPLSRSDIPSELQRTNLSTTSTVFDNGGVRLGTC